MGSSLYKVSSCTHCFTRSSPALQGMTFLFDRSQRSKHLVYLVPEAEFKIKGEKGAERNQITQKGCSAVSHLNGMEPEMSRDKVFFLPRHWEFVWPWHNNLPHVNLFPVSVISTLLSQRQNKQENPSHTTCTCHKMTWSKQIMSPLKNSLSPSPAPGLLNLSLHHSWGSTFYPNWRQTMNQFPLFFFLTIT